MPDLSLLPEDNQRQDMDINGLVLRNMYFAGQGAVKNGPQFLPVPGLFERESFGAPACRGLHYVQGGPDTQINKQIGNTLYAVYGGSLYGLNENLVDDRLEAGVSNEDGSPVRMASTRDQLCVVADKKAYIFDPAASSSLVLIEPSWVDADTPFEPVDVCAVGGRFVFLMAKKTRDNGDGTLTVVEKGDRIRWAAIEDGANIDVLDFITAASASDEGVALVQDRGQVIVVGRKSIEFIYQTGDADAALAIDGNLTLPIGTISRDSVIEADNTVYFVDNSFRVVRLSGSSFQVISQANDSVEARLADVSKSKRDDIVMWACTFEGHPFIGVDIPGDASLVFDAKTQLWHERKSWDETKGYSKEWEGKFVQEAFGRIFVGGKDDGSLWTFERAADSEEGDVLERIVTGILPVGGGRFRLNNVCLFTRTGLQSRSEGERTCMMRYKKPDDTWTNWRHASLGERGQRFNRAIWRNLGLMRGKDLEVQFRVTDSTPFFVDKATFNEVRL